MAYAFAHAAAALPRARQDQRRGHRAGSAETLGGIRVVKAYTAEKREEIVFTKGAHRLFRNIAQTMTGVSAIDRGHARVIIGAIGVLMILVGGRAILAGRMTLGDLVMYMLLHRPAWPRR